MLGATVWLIVTTVLGVMIGHFLHSSLYLAGSAGFGVGLLLLMGYYGGLQMLGSVIELIADIIGCMV